MPAGREILSLAPPPYDHKVAYGPGSYDFGYLRVPKSKGPHPVVIVIHGGFWRAAFDLEHSGHMCAALTRAGLATWSLEYRRIGHQGGGWPGTFQDVQRGAAHVRPIAAQYGLNASRVVAIGHSAGGHLAVSLGADPGSLSLRGIVSLAGVVDLRRGIELKLGGGVVSEFMAGAPGDLAKASPIERLPIRTPVRLIHGDQDDIVPLEISRRYQEAAVKAGDNAKLVVLPGAGHFELIDPRYTKEWAQVEKAVLELI